MWTWLAIGVVVALVGTLVLVKVVGGSTLPRTTTSQAVTPAAVLAEVTSIPASVYDAVGVGSPTVPIAAPVAVSGLRRLDFTSAAGHRLAGVLFVGAEYCSFCASERWALIAALSRFGKFPSLYDMDSSALDFAPSTPSFTFNGVSYSSHRVVLRAYEVRSDVPTTTNYQRLASLPSRFRNLERQLGASAGYPFVDIANAYVVRLAAFSPLALAGETREQIAGALVDPGNPVTRAIVASANYLSAAICSADGQQPASVCGSPGVQAAAAAMRPTA